MNTIEQSGLNFTDDFSIACTINYFRQEDVLQYFINRVSFYAFNGGEMEAAALWATHIIIDCKDTLGAVVNQVPERRIQRISVKYISLLSDLEADSRLTTVDKMKESFLLMQEWESEMLPDVNYPTAFHLDEQRFLDLTFDFNLLCRMNGISEQQALQYFINQISLAKQSAENLLNFTHKNASMSFFEAMLLSKSMRNKRLPFQHAIHKLYTDRLLTIDEWLKEEQDVDKRLLVYKAFYAEWYHNLVKSLN